MKLNNAGVQNAKEWLDAGYKLPEYDREAVTKKTKEAPFWIHFGAGNIFRAFQANVVQNLLNEGVLDRGLIVTEGYDYEIIEKMYLPHDSYSILATLKADGNIEKTVIGSVVESLVLDSENDTHYGRLKEIFEQDSLQMVSFTITEKGYSVIGPDGQPHAFVKKDLDEKGLLPDNIMGKICALLYERFKNGATPIAMVSMDNCSHNGEKLRASVVEIARAWEKNGFVPDWKNLSEKKPNRKESSDCSVNPSKPIRTSLRITSPTKTRVSNCRISEKTGKFLPRLTRIT